MFEKFNYRCVTNEEETTEGELLTNMEIAKMRGTLSDVGSPDTIKIRYILKTFAWPVFAQQFDAFIQHVHEKASPLLKCIKNKFDIISLHRSLESLNCKKSSRAFQLHNQSPISRQGRRLMRGPRESKVGLKSSGAALHENSQRQVS